tara:strand:- start:8490 stop:8867 length:378 start_codon:yes stop_codon:yes gene_type:complete
MSKFEPKYITIEEAREIAKDPKPLEGCMVLLTRRVDFPEKKPAAVQMIKSAIFDQSGKTLIIDTEDINLLAEYKNWYGEDHKHNQFFTTITPITIISEIANGIISGNKDFIVWLISNYEKDDEQD